MSNYFRHIQITLRSAVQAGWLVDAKANTDLQFTIRLLTSDKAMRFYVRALDTAIWLCKAIYVACEITIMLGAIAATWIDEQVTVAQQPVEAELNGQFTPLACPINLDEQPTLSESEAVEIVRSIVAAIPARAEIVEEPIDWEAWTADDLKKASQRAPFNIPLRVNGKVASKAALVEMYDDALHFAVWGEEGLEAA